MSITSKQLAPINNRYASGSSYKDKAKEQALIALNNANERRRSRNR